MAALTLLELSDRAQITDVLYRYAKGIDDGDPSRILSCFASDIHLEQLGRVVTGIDAVTRLFRGELGGPKSAIGVDRINASTHVLANILIELDGNAATADTQGIANLHATRDGDDVFLVRGIRYLDSFRKVDGHWLIARRVHTESWQFEALPAPLPAPSVDGA